MRNLSRETWIALVIGTACLEAVALAEPAAIVTSLNHRATVVSPGRQARDLQLFDWIPADSLVETEVGASLTVAFQTGARFEMEERAKARVTGTGLTMVAGRVRPLTSVPRLPHLSELIKPPNRAGAIRIRGERIGGLYPSGQATTLAGGTVLRFEPVSGPGSHKVEIEDQAGTTIFEANTRSSAVAVPAGVLEPGATYSWTVRTLDPIGSVARGEAEFSTLTTENERDRATLKQALERAGDAESLGLLAAIEGDLGLFEEAREDLQRAVSKAPRDAALKTALERAERRLSADKRAP